MSVSLVKRPITVPASTIVYVVGYAYGPYSPDPDNVHAYATIDDARSALADELERAADAMWEQELDTARDEYANEDEYNANYTEAHEGSASISGSAGLVKSDRDGDIAWSVARHEGWSTNEPDGYNYWIHAAPIGEVFGGDTTSDEYLDLVDEILS